MNSIDKVILDTHNIVEVFESKMEKMAEELKTSIENHYKDMEIVKAIRKDSKFNGSVVIFDMANDAGCLYSSNCLLDTESGLNKLEMYDNDLYWILEKEAMKVKNRINSNIELGHLVRNYSGIILMMTNEGLSWEDYEL